MRTSRALAEMALFVVAAAAGVFGMGEAFRGGGMWLAVTGVAVMVLGKQMDRVHGRWPTRPPVKTGPPVPARCGPGPAGQEEGV